MAKKNISEVLINFKGDHKDLDRSIQKSESSLSKFSKSAKYAAGALVAIGAVGAVALAGLTFASWKMTTSFTDLGGEIDKTMKITGLGAETITTMAYAAEQEHASIEDLQTGWKRLAKSMLDADDGLAESVRTFDSLGLAIYDDTGKLKKLDQMTLEIADTFRGMSDDTKKAALAQDLFGRSGINMIPFLEMGSKGIRELQEESVRLGNVWTDDMAASAKVFDDKLTALKYSLRTTKWEIGNALLPEFEKIVDWLMENGDWIKTTFSEIFDIEVTEFGDAVVNQLDKVKNWVDENKADIKWWVDAAKSIPEWRGEMIQKAKVERTKGTESLVGKSWGDAASDANLKWGTKSPRGQQSIQIILDHFAVDKFLRGETVEVMNSSVISGT